MVYYFDTLPLRPQPEHLESFTGYLTRIASCNGLQTVNRVASLFFPEQAERVVSTWNDFPVNSFGTLLELLQVAETSLRATTFYHLPRKFGRKTNPQATSRFLAEMLGAVLRYCPLCLAEKEYYQLPWRFLLIKGCLKHQCYLLEQCTYCQKPVPLFASPLKIGCCPNCGGRLQSCQSYALPVSELKLLTSYVENINFLLSPDTKLEETNQIERIIGRSFAKARLERRLAVREITDLIGESWDRIGGIERGEAYRQGISLQSYLKYAALLGLNLKDVFRHVSFGEVRLVKGKQRGRRQVIEKNELLQKVVTAIMDLDKEGQPITQRAISRITGLAPSSLRYYPEIAGIVAGIVAKNRCEQRILGQKRETDLVSKLGTATKVLESQGKAVTQVALSNLLGISIPTLKKYPQVRQILMSF